MTPLVVDGSDEDWLTIEGPYLWLSPDQHYTFEEAVNAKTFVKYEHFTAYPLHGEYVWGKFVIVNPSGVDQVRYLEIPDNKIGKIEVFWPENGKYTIYKGGSDYPFYPRQISFKDALFEVRIPAKSELEVYYRTSSFSQMYPVFWMKKAPILVGNAVVEYYLYGFFCGIMILAVLFTSFVYWQLGEKTYLYFTVYVAIICLFFMAYNGTAFQLLWPDLPELNRYAYLFLLPVMVVFQLQYTKHFLKLHDLSKVWVQVLNVIMLMRVLYFLWAFFFVKHLLFYFYIDVIPVFVSMGAALYAYKKGERFARYFLLGITFLAAGYVIFVASYFNLIPVDLFTYNAIGFGSIFEIGCLTMAISDRLKIEVQDRIFANRNLLKEYVVKEELQSQLIAELSEKEQLKDKVNKELEAKVSDRTRELEYKGFQLEDANGKLQQYVEKLDKMNSELDRLNWELNKTVKEEQHARISSSDADFIDFSRVYAVENDCLKYLYNYKWSKGFVCKKCGNTNYSKGNQPYSAKCTKCNYIETATAGTIFHGCRFELTKAFYIVYIVSLRGDNISAQALADTLNLRMQTCWKFRQKALERKEMLEKLHKNDRVVWEQLVLE